MKRLISWCGACAAILAGASPALAAPRLTHGPVDFVLMPLFGYFLLIGVAQAVAMVSAVLNRGRV
jgi:hypothetical protein